MYSRQSGLSLIEIIVAIVILAIALIGITTMMQGALSRSADTTLEVRTVALAQAYLDEILGKRFDEKTRPRGVPPCRAPDGPGGVPASQECTVEGSFGTDAGESNRSRYDDVDDYHGIDEGDGGLNPNLEDAEGNTRTGYDNFRVQIDVRYINTGVGEEEEGLNVSAELDDDYDAKLIRVTVSHRSLDVGAVFSAYKANF